MVLISAAQALEEASVIDLRQLRAVHAVAAEGSVARAARRLGWSGPTVDYHLRALDARVGAPVANRTTRGTTLTAAGALLADRAEEILALADRALSDARDVAQIGRARVRFGSFPTAAGRLLPRIAQHVRSVGLDFDAVLEEIAPLVDALNRRALDAALVYAAPGATLPFRAGVETTRLLLDPVLIALPESHPAAVRTRFDRLALLALPDAQWVLGATPGDTLDDVVRQTFEQAGRPFTVAVRTDDYAVALSMVAAELGVGLIPQLAAAHPPPGVVLRPIDDPLFAREILLATSGPVARASFATRELAEGVRRAITERDRSPRSPTAERPRPVRPLR